MAAASQSSIVIGIFTASVCASVGIPMVFLDDQWKRVIYLSVAGGLCTIIACVIHFFIVIRPLRSAQHAIGLCLEAVMEHNHTVSSNAPMTDLDMPMLSSGDGGGGSGRQFSPTSAFAHVNGVGRHEEAVCGEALRRLAEQFHVGSKHCEMFGLQCSMKDFVLAVAAALRLRYQQHIHLAPPSGGMTTVAPSPITSSTSTSARLKRSEKNTPSGERPPSHHHALETDAGAFECD